MFRDLIASEGCFFILIGLILASMIGMWGMFLWIVVLNK